MGERRLRGGSTGDRWMRRVGGLLVLVGLLHLADPMAGAAGDVPSYTASGTAYAIDLLVENESLPLGLDVQAAGPAASVQAGSTLGERSFASFPYPGESVAGITGLLAGVFGVPLPPYPAYVVAATGEAPKDASLPGLTLQAEAAPRASAARASVGSGGAGFTSTSRIEVTEEGEVVVAAKTTGGVAVGGVLSIGAVESSASVHRRGDGELDIVSDMRIGSITVPGLALRIPESTPSVIPIPIPIPGLPQLPPLELPPIPLALGGTVLTAPEISFQNGQFVVDLSIAGSRSSYAIPAKPVTDALALLGITFTYQEARPIIDGNDEVIGVSAPVARLQFEVPALPANDYFNGPVRVTLDLGRTEATIESRVDEPVSSILPEGGTTGSIAAPDFAGGLPEFGSPSLAPTGAAGAPTGAPEQLARISLGRDVTSIYLVLVGVAFIGLSLAGAFRTLGVRNRWT